MTDPIQSDQLGGLASRRAAISLVEGAFDHRGGLDEALTRPPFSVLDVRDRALARMMAMTVLRRLGAIDRLLEPRLRKAPPMAVMMLLRLGVAQARYLDTPAFAAVDTTVRLAESDPVARPFKGLINAVLRGLLRDAPPEPDVESLAPSWLFARWRAAYGAAAASAVAAMIVQEPAFDLTPRDPSDAAALAELLQAEALPGGSLRLRGRGDVAEWPGYAEGRWWVQDAAAAVPARLLHLRPGETALDICAAPGGKTLQLASAGAQVTALDRSASRLKRLAESLARTGLKAEIVTADAGRWSDRRQFDAVLLDAPCSATGTFRRDPDVLWGSRASDIAQLAALQTRLLDANAERVRPGGRLVYCVCSLEPEEGEAQIAAFLRRRPDFKLDPIAAGEGGAPAPSVTPEGTLRVLPHHCVGGLDGFFAARLVRTAGGPL
jgi:16S rRNA (cytosine967-C5)-methyltransferase